MKVLHRIDFTNTEVAFKDCSDKDLRSSYRLFSMMNNPLIIKIANNLAVLGVKLRLPINWIIKKTVFRQFCGGENIKESLKVVEKLGQSGIFSILDYSVEAGNREADFDSTANEIISIITAAKDNPNITYTSLKMNGIASHDLMAKIQSVGIDKLNPAERDEFERATSRLERICNAAQKEKVPFYVDAEESWIQGTVDSMVVEMMRKYNKEWAVISNTLQMYLRDKLDYLYKCYKISEKERFYLGIKFVRGAYWEKERRRADEMGYSSPVFSKKEETDHAYNEAIRFSINHIDRIVIDNASHNEESSMLMAELIDEKGIERNHPHAWFSQLYGMSNHISYNLAEAGYNVSKYVPYGPVKSVLPYLIRRAEENSAIAGQMGRELRLIIKERERRKNQIIS